MPADQILARIQTLRTVFLDRDGVLNRKMPEGAWVTGPEELSLLAGVPEAVARLNRAGLLVLVVTNQRGIAQGRLTAEGLKRIHDGLLASLGSRGAHLDGIFVCPHERGECECRKPLTGMFEQAKAKFPALDAMTSVMVGDSLSDMQFGRTLGMLTILLRTNAEMHEDSLQRAESLADASFAALSEAVDFLLASRECNS